MSRLLVLFFSCFETLDASRSDPKRAVQQQFEWEQRVYTCGIAVSVVNGS